MDVNNARFEIFSPTKIGNICLLTIWIAHISIMHGECSKM